VNWIRQGEKENILEVGPRSRKVRAGGGRLHGITGEKYQVEVYEAIPPGVTGFVPVRAQVARFGDVGIVPVRE
jgi:hypothetical protein